MSNCAISTCSNYYRTTEGTAVSYHRFPKDDVFRKRWILKCKRKDKFNPVTARVCSIHFQPSDYERDLKAELLGIQRQKKLKSDAVPTQHLLSTPNTTNQLLERDKKTTMTKCRTPTKSVNPSVSATGSIIKRSAKNPKKTIASIKRRSAVKQRCTASVEENRIEEVYTDHCYGVTVITPLAFNEQFQVVNVDQSCENFNSINGPSKGENDPSKHENDLSKLENNQVSRAQISKRETPSRSRKERYNVRSIRKRALERLMTISPNITCDKATNTDSVYVNMQAQIKTLEKKNAFLTLQLNKLYAVKMAKEVRLKQQMSELKDKMKKKEEHHQIAIKAAEKNLQATYKKVFSDAQIRWLQRGKKNRIYWEDEDIAFSLTLRSLSRKCYTYLRKRGFPLPGLTTLRKWNRNANCTPNEGSLQEVQVCSEEATPSIEDNNAVTYILCEENELQQLDTINQLENEIPYEAQVVNCEDIITSN